MRPFRGIAAALLALAVACGGDPDQGPGEIAFDRDACDHCRMLISDPLFAAQVRDAEGRLHRFDDPGCAVLWLDADPARRAREVWVQAVDTKTWVAAEEARFVDVGASPMGYGFAARSGADPGSIGFEDLRARIREIDGARR